MNEKHPGRRRFHTASRQARFEAFAKMRLAGRSDEVYRNYKLPRHENVTLYDEVYSVAGFHEWRDSEYLLISHLRELFRRWGYGYQSEGAIKGLLTEYSAYNAVVERNKQYRYREPDEIRRLVEEDIAARSDQLKPL